MLDFSGASEFSFESIDIRPANERIVADGRGDCSIDLALDGLILKLQISEGYRHLWSSLFPLTKRARRISGIGAGGGDVSGHDGACSDHDIVDDTHRHDRGVGSNRNPIAYHGLAPQLLARPPRTAGHERIIDEHNPMAHKPVFSDCHQLADDGMRLHADTG